MSLRLVAVGRKHESWVDEGIERYQKRLKRPFDAEWVFIATFCSGGRDGASGRV